MIEFWNAKFYNLLIKLSVVLCYAFHVNTRNVTSRCRERNRLISTEEQDLYEVFEIELGQTVILCSHYCYENDDGVMKIWTRANYFINVSTVDMELANNNKFMIGKDNSLIVNSVNTSDSGLYKCKRRTYDTSYSETNINYYIDVVNKAGKPYYGDVDGWRMYVKTNLTRINEMFLYSNYPEFLYLRDVLGRQINVISVWESRQPCDGCLGLVKRTAFCRLRNMRNGTMNESTQCNKGRKNHKFLSVYQLSCHSIQFGELFPIISSELRKIPDYVIVNSCTGPCEASSNKTSKYHNTHNLKEGSFLTLTCPEASIQNKVQWYKNGFFLNPGIAENRMEVDIFGTLSLINVKKKDAGNYSCYVDNVYIQDDIITITSNSFVQNTEFLWQNIYLGIIFIVNFFFFCIGICIKWNDRHDSNTIHQTIHEENEREQLIK